MSFEKIIDGHNLLDINCPIEILSKAALSSCKPWQLCALKHSMTPYHLKKYLSTEYFKSEALARADELISGKGYDEKYKSYLDIYLKTFLPLSLPNFFNYDSYSVEDRKRDQWRGRPYTSNKWPWPKCSESGESLVPAIQIDLSNASRLLDLELGDGLLQVWFDYSETISRVIPRIDLSDPVTDVPEVTVSSINLFEYEEPYFIEWLPVGVMFPRVLDSFTELLDNISDYEYGEQEDLSILAAEKIPVLIDSYFGCANTYLGGYWHRIGNEGGWAEWPTDPDLPNFGMRSRVIFQIWDSNRISFLIVVIFDEENRPEFVANVVRT